MKRNIEAWKKANECLKQEIEALKKANESPDNKDESKVDGNDGASTSITAPETTKEKR